MAKNSIRDFSATAGSNTDIQSVDIDENCAASGLNNAIRELMADIADFNSGTVGIDVLSLADDDNSAQLKFQAPSAVTTTTTFTLPDGDGTDGQVIKTDGSGTLSWTDLSSTLNNISGATVSSSDPAANSNVSAAGELWVNSSTGDAYVCVDATNNSNVWINVGDRSGGVNTNVTCGVMLIGGGGGGTRGTGSGGSGAGGYLEGTMTLDRGQSYSVVIGAGGAGGAANDTLGAKGGDSTFNGATALAGGVGSRNGQIGLSGGSGGGAGGAGVNSTYRANTAATQGNSGGLTGFGNTGGTTSGYNLYSGSGGGGAGAAGSGISGNNGGAGGAGKTWNGFSVGGGGGGGTENSSASGGAGGSGGGGAGSKINESPSSGTANTGGGAGGAGGAASTVGNGGSGTVVIRYQSSTQIGSGGTVTSSGGYYYHQFTSSGTFSL